MLLYFVLESAAGTSVIGYFGVVWPLVIIAIGLMLLGVPIVDALIFGTFVAFLPQGELALLPMPQGMTNSLDYLLLAIPFFMLAAGLMNVGGITERLMALASSLVGHFRGGLGHVNVLTNTLMGGVSGSSTADAAAIAKTHGPGHGAARLSQAVQRRAHQRGVDPRQHDPAEPRADHLWLARSGFGRRAVRRHDRSGPADGADAVDRRPFRLPAAAGSANMAPAQAGARVARRRSPRCPRWCCRL